MRLTPISSVPFYIRDLFEIMRLDMSVGKHGDKAIFESRLSNLIGVEHVRTFQSGSLAFYNLLKYLKGVENEMRREVILPAYTCPSLCYAVRDAGLIPVFADINSSFYPDINDICELISTNTLAIVVVHMFGNTSFDLSGLKAKIKVNDKSPYIIEDMCQALGDMKDRISNNFSDYYVLSFGRAKMISTLNGGAVLSSTDTFLKSATRDCDEGKGWKIKFVFKFLLIYFIQNDFLYYWVQKYRAFKRRKDKYDLDSYKIKEFNDLELNPYQYALGTKMIFRLNNFNKERQLNGNIYRSFFKEMKPSVISDHQSLFWRYPVIFKSESEKLHIKREFMMQGIYATTGNYPVAHEIPEMSSFVAGSKYPVAKIISSTVLMLPVHPNLSRNRLVKILKEIKI